MTLTQDITLDIYEAPLFEYINAKQEDNISRVLVVTLTANGQALKPDPKKAKAYFRATKPDRTGVEDPAVIGEDGKITVKLTDQTLAVPGDVAAEITVVEGSEILTSATFYIQVERRQGGQSVTSANEFLVMVEAAERANAAAGKADTATGRANDAAALIENMTVSASKVAAGGTPTAKLTKASDHYALALGLVTGDKGAKGDKGEKGDTGPQGPVGPAGGVDSVNGGTGDVIVGGKNLVLRSNVEHTSTSYSLHTYNLSEPFVKGEVYTVEFELIAADGKTQVLVFPGSTGTGHSLAFDIAPDGHYYGNLDMLKSSNLSDDELSKVQIYLRPSSVKLESTIKWISIKRGYAAPGYEPAPEDIPSMAPVQSVNGQQGDVVIGGRNLAPGSAGELTYTGGTSNSLVGPINIPDVLSVGDTVSISFEMKGENPENQLYLDLRAQAGGSSVLSFDETRLIANPTTEYKRYTWTAKIADPGPYRVAVFWRGTSGGAGTITYKNIKVERGNVPTDWSPAPEDYLGPFNIYDIPEMHRNIYRGKNLGISVTEAQKAAIAAGTWDDLYVGDYWTINGRVYRIADMDYWYNSGDTAFTRHHLVIVPDKSLGSAQMNSANTTGGGYMLSEMRTKNLDEAKAIIKDAFGDLVLSHREIFTNEVKDGYPSGYEWTDSEVDLMNEIMVYGCNAYSTMGNGTINPATCTIDNSQLALFALNPRMIKTRYTYWLRDVVSSGRFASVLNYGHAFYGNASTSRVIRPIFAIGVPGSAADEPMDGPEIMGDPEMGEMETLM